MKRKPCRNYFSTKLKNIYKFDNWISHHLVRTYGERAFDVAKMARTNPGYDRKIVKDQPFLIGEIFYSM